MCDELKCTNAAHHACVDVPRNLPASTPWYCETWYGIHHSHSMLKQADIVSLHSYCSHDRDSAKKEDDDLIKITQLYNTAKKQQDFLPLLLYLQSKSSSSSLSLPSTSKKLTLPSSLSSSSLSSLSSLSSSSRSLISANLYGSEKYAKRVQYFDANESQLCEVYDSVCQEDIDGELRLLNIQGVRLRKSILAKKDLCMRHGKLILRDDYNKNEKSMHPFVSSKCIHSLT